MKKFLLTAIFACLMAAVGFAQNLITNGGFETWTVNDPLTNMPASWARGAGTVGTHYFHATDAVQGNIMRLKDNVGSAGAKRFNTTTDFSISAEGTYRVTFKVKGDVGLRFVALVKGTASPSSSAQSATNHFTNIIGYTSPTEVPEWTTVETDIVVPSNATFGDDYRLHLSWSHSTTTLYCDFYIDDIRLEKLPSVPTALENKRLATTNIYGSNGRIHFNTNDNASYIVLSMSGSKVAEGVASNGDAIALPKGIYIVKTEQKSFKVVL